MPEMKLICLYKRGINSSFCKPGLVREAFPHPIIFNVCHSSLNISFSVPKLAPPPGTQKHCRAASTNPRDSLQNRTWRYHKDAIVSFLSPSQEEESLLSSVTPEVLIWPALCRHIPSDQAIFLICGFSHFLLKVCVSRQHPTWYCDQAVWRVRPRSSLFSGPWSCFSAHPCGRS